MTNRSVARAWLAAIALVALACGAPARGGRWTGSAAAPQLKNLDTDRKDAQQLADLDTELKDAAARAEAEVPCREHPELDCPAMRGHHHPERALDILAPALAKWGDNGRPPLQSAARLLMLRGRLMLGRPVEARASFQSAVDIYEGVQRPAEDDVLVAAKHGLATYVRQEHPEDAERLDEDVVTLLARLHGADSAQVRHALLRNATIKRSACNPRAHADLERLEQSASRTNDLALTLTVLHERASTEARLQRYAAALALVDRGIALARHDQTRFRNELSSFHGLGSNVAWELGDLNRALSFAEAHLHLEQRAEKPRLGWSALQVASVLALRGDEMRLAALAKETGQTIDVRPIKTVDIPNGAPRACRPNSFYGWRTLNTINDELVDKCPNAITKCLENCPPGMVRLDIASDGTVARALLASDAFTEPLRSCVLDVVSRATFPQAEPGGERLFVLLMNHHFWSPEDRALDTSTSAPQRIVDPALR